MDYAKLEERAKELGFSHIGPLDPKTIVLKQEVRDMCQPCARYNKCWSCPPGCPSLEENRETVGKYTRGILVQSTGEMEDSMDYEVMMETEAEHKKRFLKFYGELRKEFPNMTALGAGTCSQCKECTYPDAPCRFPDRMVSSMEAFGMVVTEVCVANDMKYYYGLNTITYSSCYLLE